MDHKKIAEIDDKLKLIYDVKTELVRLERFLIAQRQAEVHGSGPLKGLNVGHAEIAEQVKRAQDVLQKLK